MTLLPAAKTLQTAAAATLLTLAAALSADAATLRFSFETTAFTLADGACEAEYQFDWQAPAHCGDRVTGWIEVRNADFDTADKWLNRNYKVTFDDTVSGPPYHRGDPGVLPGTFRWFGNHDDSGVEIDMRTGGHINIVTLAFSTNGLGEIVSVMLDLLHDRPDFTIQNDKLTWLRFGDDDPDLFQYQTTVSWEFPIKPITFPSAGGGGSVPGPVPGGGGGGTEVPAVPLPAAGWLGLAGLAGLVALRRRAGGLRPA